MTDQLDLPNAPTSVRAVRHFLASCFEDLTAEMRDAVLLMASELATNSVRYTKGPIRVSVTRTDEGIRVSIADSSPLAPVMRTPSPQDAMGRGLRIVDALADRWGVDQVPGGGKEVWFSLRSSGAA